MRPVGADLSVMRTQAIYRNRLRGILQQMWAHLGLALPRIGTASVFLQIQERLFVMGFKGMGMTLFHPFGFHPFGFQPSSGVQQLIGNQVPFMAISRSELERFAGERIFLLVVEDGLLREHAKQLVRTPEWEALALVQGREGQIHMADAKWNFDDPLTMDRLISRLPGILKIGE